MRTIKTLVVVLGIVGGCMLTGTMATAADGNTEYGIFTVKNPTNDPVHYQVKWGDSGTWLDANATPILKAATASARVRTLVAKRCSFSRLRAASPRAWQSLSANPTPSRLAHITKMPAAGGGALRLAHQIATTDSNASPVAGARPRPMAPFAKPSKRSAANPALMTTSEKRKARAIAGRRLPEGNGLSQSEPTP